MDYQPVEKLLHAIRYDPLINKKIINILEMESYQRRIVLSNWLEQLRRNNAPGGLTQSLSYFFDEQLAEKVLTFLKDPEMIKTKNT